jgi:hypothetical protein
LAKFKHTHRSSYHYRNSSYQSIVPSCLYGNVCRGTRKAAQTKDKTRSIFKYWRYNFHSFKRWSFSNYPIYRISDRAQGMRALLDYNFQNETNNMSWMWFNNKQEKEPYTIPGRNVMLSWWQKKQKKAQEHYLREEQKLEDLKWRFY